MSNLSANLALAQQLIDWSAEPQIGVTPQANVNALALALQMLRPLADSLEPGHEQAAWLLCLHADSDEDSLRYYAIAAAWDHPEALASLETNGDEIPGLRAAVAHERARIAADV